MPKWRVPYASNLPKKRSSAGVNKNPAASDSALSVSNLEAAAAC